MLGSDGGGGGLLSQKVSENDVVAGRFCGMSHRMAKLCLLGQASTPGGWGGAGVASLSSGRGHARGGDSPPCSVLCKGGSCLLNQTHFQVVFEKVPAVTADLLPVPTRTKPAPRIGRPGSVVFSATVQGSVRSELFPWAREGLLCLSLC